MHPPRPPRSAAWTPLVTVAVTGLTTLALTLASGGGPPAAAAPAQSPGGSPADLGRQLYQHDCATCHGSAGAGTYRGPELTDVGLASVDFMVGTGRMPIDSPYERADRGEPWYPPDEQQALLAYVSGFVTEGPAIPDVPVAPSGAGDPADAPDVARGGELYRTNCAACHHAIGSGGALAYGAEAPPLDRSTPVQVVEAMRIGPGRMPVFGPDLFPEADAEAIATYVQLLREPPDRGGWGLGHIGPVAEGLVAVAAGLGSLVVVTRWLGTRSPAPEPSSEPASEPAEA